MFNPHEPFGISVINKQVLEEIVKTGVLDLNARKKIAEIMSGVSTNVFSMHDETEKGEIYFALKKGDFTPPLAFQAVQMTFPEINKNVGGRVIFGEDAQRMYKRVESLHHQNLEEGRGRDAILEILDV